MEEPNKKEDRRLSAQRKNSMMKAVWIILAVAVVGGIVWWSSTAKEEKKIVENSLTTVVADDYVKGNSNAPVTLIEYLDFECEACGAYFPLVKQLEQAFPNDLRVVRRYYPLPGHKNSLPAALAVEASARQGKYDEMHDLLFTEQEKWGNKPAPTPAVFEAYAEKLGLDLTKFKQDVASQSVKDRVQRDVSSGTKLGNTGTPSFYLNGAKIQNPKSLEDFKILIKAEILKAPEPRRNKLKMLIDSVNAEEITSSSEAENLASTYVKEGLIPEKHYDDALHIAIATVSRCNFIVSWNFSHIVRAKVIMGVHHINHRKGFGLIEIVSPEHFVGKKE